MTRIKVCVSDVLNDPEYVYRTQIKKMVREVNDFTDSTPMDIQRTALREMKRLFDTGFCAFTPPICGLLTRIGYFDNQAILDSAIGYLEHRVS